MNNKDLIIEYMLKLIDAEDKRVVAKTVEYFKVSKSSVYNYLAELENSRDIEKGEQGYVLTFKQYDFAYQNNKNLGEDRVFNKDIAPLLSELPKNVFSIWRYAFTEMMNNAIEHSSAENIIVSIRKNRLNTRLFIHDDGVGIYKNIQRFIKEEKDEELSLAECATMLFAGKFTTAKSMHSGEGIFFTSHLMDTFIIISDETVFTRNNFFDTPLINSEDATNGTLVFMELYNHSKKTAREVFDRYASVDEGFTKTSIPIAHFFPGGNPVSRSEARRLGELITRFEEIDLDFTDVDEVGQAFVHELFVLWQARNPNKKINVLCACENVDYMIKRVLNTK